MKVIVLIDGEHHPSVVRWGLDAARAAGFEPLAAVMVGGTEKLGTEPRAGPAGLEALTGLPVLEVGGAPMAGLGDAIERFRPGAIVDLSDEPVLDHERRMELVAVALRNGIPYVGGDFRFEPPITEPALGVPTLAVIGTGKRVGKTAVSAHIARLVAPTVADPTIVAVGRGGPPEPRTAGPRDVTLEALLARAGRGEHAASDYLEDALVAGVRTVGARRIGGGLFGRPFATNVAEAAAHAARSGAGLIILEGSGSALPTVPWDAGVLVAPASLPAAHLAGYGGPLRLLLSDLLVLMLGTGLNRGPDHLSTLTSHAHRLAPDVRVAVAELRPVALGDVKAKDAFFATTAGGRAAVRLSEHLERTAGCRIVRTSSRLADRAGLEEDLRTAPRFDVLLTELKAAAVDVAAKRALERGAEVVFVDNRPIGVGEGEDAGDLDGSLREIARLGMQRAAQRGATVAPRPG
jgi:cyclic 2,3-diphosphoglycerate synthetase